MFKSLKYFFIIQQILTVTCHVAFVYPQARSLPLDFLDNISTIEPCGIPKSANSTVTDFVVGRPYNLTWTQSTLFHTGGVRINLLDPSGNKLKQLFPSVDGQFTPTFLVNAVVTFTEPCANCIIQIQTQALENGPKYLYHSCGDVQIIRAVTNNDAQLCSGNGAYLSNRQTCSCTKGYLGSACQYRQDCETDSDCGINGKCHLEVHPASIQKSCYCAFGYFGRNCEANFRPESSDEACFNYGNLADTNPPRYSVRGLFAPQCYSKMDLNGDDVIYSRTVGSDVEIILDFNTTGWAAIGWRPMDLDTNCRSFPSIGTTISQSGGADDYESTGFLKSAFDAVLAPMDCTDIVSVSVINGRSRFQDMYSRDRSRPLPDSFYEGKFSLDAAYAVERDGRTVAMFRRNIQSSEQSDHPLGPGEMHGIYAKEAEGNDEFRYHGHASRGVDVYEFVKAPLTMPTRDSPSPLPIPVEANTAVEKCHIFAVLLSIVFFIF